MDKAKKATEIIEEKRKLPEAIKDRLNNYAFMNLIISIALMIYMISINILYLNEGYKIFIGSVKVFAMTLIIIDVLIFEVGYRKDNIKIWIHAFELLVCSIIVLSLQYTYIYAGTIVRSIFMLLPVFCSIYYVAKIIIMHILETKKYQNNLSDVRELMKDEQEGYLDDIKEDSIINDVKNIEEIKKQEREIIKKAKKNNKK